MDEIGKVYFRVDGEFSVRIAFSKFAENNFGLDSIIERNTEGGIDTVYQIFDKERLLLRLKQKDNGHIIDYSKFVDGQDIITEFKERGEDLRGYESQADLGICWWKPEILDLKFPVIVLIHWIDDSYIYIWDKLLDLLNERFKKDNINALAKKSKRKGDNPLNIDIYLDSKMIRFGILGKTNNEVGEHPIYGFKDHNNDDTIKNKMQFRAVDVMKSPDRCIDYIVEEIHS